jgi:hypothetical protein
MNRETFQRYALVTLVVLVAALAVRGRHGRHHSFGDRCRVERHVERHVDVHGPMALDPLPPLPPVPPAPPPPPPPPAPPAPPPPPMFAAGIDERAIEREVERHLAEVDRFEADVERQMEAHERALEAHERAMEAREREMERHQRRFRIRVPTLMTVAAAPAAASRDEVLYERSFAFRRGDRLAVGLSSEDVVVETARGAQATVRVMGRGADARAEFERRRFEARYEDGALRVRTNPPRRDGLLPRRLQAGFTVVVAIPVEAQVDVATSSGDVRIERAEGRQASVATSSGDIALGTLRADRISIAASSGDVSADALDGAVEVATSSGDVEIGRLAGRSASVATSSGDVAVRSAEAARFSATTSSGNVEAGGLSAAASVTTGSGDVELRFARVAAVEVQTGSGEVALTLPRGAGATVALAGPDIEIEESLAFQGDRERRSAQGRIGRGGPAVSVSTGSGGIELYAR